MAGSVQESLAGSGGKWEAGRKGEGRGAGRGAGVWGEGVQLLQDCPSPAQAFSLGSCPAPLRPKGQPCCSSLPFGPPRGGACVLHRSLPSSASRKQGAAWEALTPTASLHPARQADGRVHRQSLSAKGISLHFLNKIIYMMY